MPVKIFFCYAHEDELLLNKLKTHLRPLQRVGLIETWYDRDISAGTKWEEEIDKNLNEADIILLLVSPDFMDSDYCYGKEMQRALKRDQRGEARVIPVILRPVYWQDVLGALQALPTDANPVMSSHWQYQDEAFFNVTEGIRKVVQKLMSNQNLSMQNESSNILISEPILAKEAITPRHNMQEDVNLKLSYQLFFADLLERLKIARPGITNAKKTQPENFWMLGAGKTGFEFMWTFSKEGLKMGFVINIPGSIDATKKAFDALYEQRDEIEREFGQSLLWERRSEGKESHISLIRPATMADPEDTMEQTKIWAVETMLKFVDVFRKRISMV